MLSGRNENGINYYTARKLKDMSQSLEQLAKAFDDGAGETGSLTKDDGLAAMQTCATLVCGSCGGCSLYADSEKEDSYYLYYLLRIFEQNGHISTEDMPELFKKTGLFRTVKPQLCQGCHESFLEKPFFRKPGCGHFTV